MASDCQTSFDCVGLAKDDTTAATDAQSQRESLCARCATIDIDQLVDNHCTHPGYSCLDECKPLMNLGRLDADARLLSCSLCQLFNMMKMEETTEDGGDYMLFFVEYPDVRSCLFVARGVATVDDCYRMSRRVKSQGSSIVCTTATKHTLQLHAIPASFINSRHTDLDRLRDILNACVTSHQDKCATYISSAKAPQNLKLIDCEQRRVVTAPSSCSFAALSYVWGDSRSHVDDLTIDGMLPQSLPQTIEDAIKVTRQLNLRYLWIDKYCIDQRDVLETKFQIGQMDLIYQAAFITIISAAGADPSYGLPGIGSRMRGPQKTVWVKRVCFCPMSVDVQEMIKASTWSQRAWTFQEAFFSTRRLFFTEQDFYFECRSGQASELNLYPLFDATQDFGPPANNLYNMDFSHDVTSRDLCDLLYQYRLRRMSFQTDALKAFEGVFHRFRTHASPVRHYLGIPIMSLPWGLRQDNPLLPKYRRSDRFVFGLCWVHLTKGARTTAFPSWSWAGWTCSIAFSRHFEPRSSVLGDMPIETFIENSDSSIIDLNQYSDDEFGQGLPTSSQRFVHIEAWTLPLQIRYFGRISLDAGLQRADRPCCAIVNDGADTIGIEMKFMNQTLKEGIHSTGSSSPLGIDEASPHDEKDRCLGVLLHPSGPEQILPQEKIFVMIVCSRGDDYERVGHVLKTVGNESGVYVGEGLARHCKPEDHGIWERCFKGKERRRIRLG